MQSSLGGNALTQMLACVSPTSHELHITEQTLRYATSARSVVSNVDCARICEETDDDPMAGDYEDDDGELNRRAIWIETKFGDVFGRCVGKARAPLILYIHGS